MDGVILKNNLMRGITASACRLLQPGHTVGEPFQMLLIRGTGVFHFAEHRARQLGAIATILVFPVVHGTVVQRAGF